MPQALRWIWIFALVVMALFLLDRLALWMESRGWLYWRKTKKRTGASLGTALLEAQALIEPEKRHAVEALKEQDADVDAQGDPPQPGPPKEGAAELAPSKAKGAPEVEKAAGAAEPRTEPGRAAREKKEGGGWWDLLPESQRTSNWRPPDSN